MTLDLIAFLIIALIILLSAISVIVSREIFHSALYLALMFLGVAALFLTLNAEFLAAIQVLVYAGGVVVLILFAIMLTKRKGEKEKIKIPLFRGFVSLLFPLVLILYITRINWWNYTPKEAVVGSVKVIGELLFKEYVLPFEVISLILLAAMIGALFLAKKEAGE
jgi:NADH-quinone oxidoreductase subunit J